MNNRTWVAVQLAKALVAHHGRPALTVEHMRACLNAAGALLAGDQDDR